jgi:hypothetical protein
MAKNLLVIFSFTQTFLFGQYIPFPTSNTTWVNYQYYFGGEWTTPTINEAVDIDNFCVTNEDTLINTLSYTKLNYCNGDYRGALRDNGGQVFFVSKDSIDELLLYDFTVDVGDTITNVFLNDNWPDTLYVSNISNITIGSSSHKTIHLSFDSAGFGSFSDYWIEGVGCSAGLLVDPFLNQNISGTYVRLECFSTSDSIFNPQSNYYYMGSGNCQLNYLSSESSIDEIIQFYPNPTSEILTLQIEKSVEEFEIKIYNTAGEMVLICNTDPNQSHTELSVSHLQSGLYFITVKNSEITYSIKFLKI